MISQLRKGTHYTLLDNESKPCEDVKYAEYIQFDSSSPVSLQDSSGYKHYTNWTILYFYLNRHLEQTDYMSASLKLSTELSKPLLTVSLLDRKDLLEYLQGKTDSCAGLSIVEEEKEDRSVKRPKLIDADAISETDKQFVNFIHSRERVLRTFTTVLLSKSAKGFENVRQLALKQLKKEDPKKKSLDSKNAKKPLLPGKSKAPVTLLPTKPLPHSTSIPLSKTTPKNESNSSIIPIILLPAAAQSLITLYNVKDLLIDKKYVPTDEYRSKGAKKPDMVEIHRDPKTTPSHVPKRFIVLDAVDSLKTPQDWYVFAFTRIKIIPNL